MVPVSDVSAPIEMPEGRGAVVAFTDIEDRVRAQELLREHDASSAAVAAASDASAGRAASRASPSSAPCRRSA